MKRSITIRPHNNLRMLAFFAFLVAVSAGYNAARTTTSVDVTCRGQRCDIVRDALLPFDPMTVPRGFTATIIMSEDGTKYGVHVSGGGVEDRIPTDGTHASSEEIAAQLNALSAGTRDASVTWQTLKSPGAVSCTAFVPLLLLVGVGALSLWGRRVTVDDASGTVSVVARSIIGRSFIDLELARREITGVAVTRNNDTYGLVFVLRDNTTRSILGAMTSSGEAAKQQAATEIAALLSIPIVDLANGNDDDNGASA